ncbi:hypothetical protein MXD81_24670, partial [Microbacteriaceae bacterium K1510]|nr:hypothetical protein [Microbacteriaceae bacterium K1510]
MSEGVALAATLGVRSGHDLGAAAGGNDLSIVGTVIGDDDEPVSGLHLGLNRPKHVGQRPRLVVGWDEHS